nr:TIGR03792 family protein [Cyanobium sp. NIES-981]
MAESPPEPRAEQPAEPTAEQPAGEAPAAVVEVLRLQVPTGAREAWLAAERDSWEPWLSRQDGFLGRQLFWDPEREEGLLLIRWASRAQWKAIPAEAVSEVQERFEQRARELTGSSTNPFPLVFEAELQPL